jgi:hypothetical protein
MGCLREKNEPKVNNVLFSCGVVCHQNTVLESVLEKLRKRVESGGGVFGWVRLLDWISAGMENVSHIGSEILMILCNFW